MATCLPKENRQNLLEALQKGRISIEGLYDMTSEQRRAKLEGFVGKENAVFVNGKFEQAMVSNQKKAFANWIERTVSRKNPVRRDMLKKVERVKKVLSPQERVGFLEDLAELKLGLQVSEEEAGFLLKTKEKIDELKAKIPENSPIRSVARLQYGLAVARFKAFVGTRKLAAETITPRERLRLKSFGKNLVDFGGFTKALLASLDNSFLGRQGLKVLITGHPKIWGRAAVNSFKDFGSELVKKGTRTGFLVNRDDAIMQGIQADILSRPNALNGKYNAAKNGYGLGVLKEEEFPSSLPQRVPILGRFFKASETAFAGSALRMRADLADAVITAAEKGGVDMLNETEASAHGRIVSSMTGRGELGKAEPAGRFLNVAFFSVRFLASNIDTLTAHSFNKNITPSARKLAAKNLMKIVTSIMSILVFANLLDEDSAELDPRSAKFGQICVGKDHNKCFDVTGGMRGLVILGARVLPTKHKGEWGWWSKSSTTGKFIRKNQGNFGEQTVLDVLESFIEGKFSPMLSVVRDVARGEHFGGDKPTVLSSAKGLVVPISAQNLMEEIEKGNDDVLLSMVMEGLGFGSTDFAFRGTSKKWKKLKEKKGNRTYNDSLRTLRTKFNKKKKKLEKTRRWKNMDNEEQNKALDKIKRDEEKRIFARHNIKL
jgi:hypothetical protein